MQQTIFKEGDKVYSIYYGWGEVEKINSEKDYSLVVKFINVRGTYTWDGRSSLKSDPTLSHTYYDFVKGGFSQRPPTPNIKVGQMIYVKNHEFNDWLLKPFSHFNVKGFVCTYEDQNIKDFNSSYLSIVWNHYSIENPFT